MAETLSRSSAGSLETLRTLLTTLLLLSRRWVALILTLALLSCLSVTRNADNGWSFNFRVTAITAVLLALVWLPAFLRVIAATGGGIKTPAGEATAAGLMDLLAALDPGSKQEVLPTLIAAADTAETEGSGASRETALRWREELEEELAALAAPQLPVERALEQYASEYERIRARHEPGGARTFEMNRLVAQVRSLEAFVPEEAIDHFFQGGTEGGRIVALALIEANPDPRDFDKALDAISASLSAFEQYHALRVMRAMVPSLDEGQRGRLLAVLEAERRDERGTNLRADASRWALMTELYRALRPSNEETRAARQELEWMVASIVRDLGLESRDVPPGSDTRPDFVVRTDGKIVVIELFVPRTREWRRRTRERREHLRRSMKEFNADAGYLVLPSEFKAHARPARDELEIVTVDELRQELARFIDRPDEG